METLNDLPYYWWGWKKSGNGWIGAHRNYLRAFRLNAEPGFSFPIEFRQRHWVWHYQKLEVMSGKITHHCVLLPGDPRQVPGVLQVWLGNWVSCDYWYRPSGSSATFLNWKGGWMVPDQDSHRWVNGRNTIWKG